MNLNSLETKAVLVFMLFSPSCAIDTPSTGNQASAGPPWQIVTFNFQTSNHVGYTLDSFPWGAGTLSDGGVWFNFPQYQNETEAIQGENVIRLWKIYDQPQSLAAYGKLAVSLAVQVQGTPIFFWQTEPSNTCGTPASVRPIFFAWYYYVFVPTDEWWSNPASYTLAPGSASFEVPFTPDQWSDEDGEFANYDQDTLDGFDFSINNMHGIGLSFGGGCYFGHGVSVTGGAARFELHSFAPVD
jgi:hypothetical protein